MTSQHIKRSATANRGQPVPPPGWRRPLFIVVAVLLGLSPFGLIELALCLCDVGKPGRYVDPFVGSSRIYPLFELDTRTSEYRTANSHFHFFAPQRFAAKKPNGGFRAFCLGGSTVLGHPYQPDTAFPKWLELELNGMDNWGGRFEIVNCGGMSYASYRLIPILEEVLGYEPDLIVVMTGHNEFLEDRTYQSIKERSAARVWIEDRLFSLRSVTLLRRGVDALRSEAVRNHGKTVLKHEVDAKLDHPGGYASYHRDEQWRQSVIHHYGQNLRVIVGLCRRAGVPIVLLNPGANLRDCPPFKSEHCADLDADQLAAWTKLFDSATAAEPDDCGRALELYRQAESLDGEHAQLVYRVARCLDRLGRFDEARAAYIRAADLDVCPLRILAPMQDVLLQVAEETDTPLVDARRLLEDESPQRIAGHDIYVDQVHPSIGGHQLIARALTDRLQDLGLVRATTKWGKRERRAAFERHLAALGDLYLAQGRQRVEFLEHWARRDRLRADTIPTDPRGLLDLGHTCLEFAQRDEAHAAYARALLSDPSLADRLLVHALELFRQGRVSTAREVTQWVLELAQDSTVQKRAGLAAALLDLECGRTETARTTYQGLRAWLEKADDGSNPWLAELPDSLKRLERLVENGRDDAGREQ